MKQAKSGGLDGTKLEELVRSRNIRCSYDLAKEMGIPHTDGFMDAACEASPGIDCLMRKNDAFSSAVWARKEDMPEMAREFGIKVVEETMEWGLSGGVMCLRRDFLDLPSLPEWTRDKLMKEFELSSALGAKEAWLKISKDRKRRAHKQVDGLKAPTGEKLEPLEVGEIEGEAMTSCVLGREAEECCGRPVYVVRFVSGMFGSVGKLEYTYKCTAVNGIVNQYPLMSKPGRFWMVMDVASDLKAGFTSDNLVRMVQERMRVLGSDLAYTDIMAAWVIVRNHHMKRRKDGLCMGYMAEADGDRWRIRARNADETSAYFAAVRRRAEEHDGGVEPKGGVEPTEADPVTVVVEQMR